MKKILFLLSLMLTPADAAAQNINCYGTTTLQNGGTGYYALQYKNTAPKTWYCVLVQVPPGGSVQTLPADNTGCITSRWDGTQWVCVPTDYLLPQ